MPCGVRLPLMMSDTVCNIFDFEAQQVEDSGINRRRE